MKELTRINTGEIQSREDRIRVRVLLRMGELNAQFPQQETTRSDFSIKSPTATASVRGTEFTMRYDPGTRVTALLVKKGMVSLDPVGAKPAVLVKAGRAMTATRAGTRPINPATIRAQDRARKLVLARVAKAHGCRLTVRSASVSAAGKRWRVTVKTSRGTATFTVAGSKVTASNGLAKQINTRCARR